MNKLIYIVLMLCMGCNTTTNIDNQPTNVDMYILTGVTGATSCYCVETTINCDWCKQYNTK